MERVNILNTKVSNLNGVSKNGNSSPNLNDLLCTRRFSSDSFFYFAFLT